MLVKRKTRVEVAVKCVLSDLKFHAVSLGGSFSSLWGKRVLEYSLSISIRVILCKK